MASTTAKCFPEKSNVQNCHVCRHEGPSCSSPPSPGEPGRSNAGSNKLPTRSIYAHKPINGSFKDFHKLLSEEWICVLALAGTWKCPATGGTSTRYLLNLQPYGTDRSCSYFNSGNYLQGSIFSGRFPASWALVQRLNHV